MLNIWPDFLSACCSQFPHLRKVKKIELSLEKLLVIEDFNVEIKLYLLTQIPSFLI